MAGWEGAGIDEAVLIVDADVTGMDWEVLDIVEAALRDLRVEPSDDAAAVLAFDLTGTALSAQYGDIGTCYTGARVTGTMTLTAPDRPAVERWLEGNVPLPFLIMSSSCPSDPEDAPFAPAFQRPFVAALADVWGPGSLPYLARVMYQDLRGDWDVALGIKMEAIDAYRGFGAGSLGTEEVASFLVGVIAAVDQTLNSEADAAVDFRAAARRLLLEYSDTDFGFTAEAMYEWRSWLDDWRSGG